GASKSLNVLTNDLFGADYGGAQQITQVTASQVGATVNISADGKTLEYSAPAGFTGEDTLTYTVDGQLKASVTIQPTIAQPYPQFSTAEEYIAFLQADALQRYEHLFGQTHYDRIYFDGVYDASNGAPVAESANVRGHSETNVQVAGVDEGDIVEFDSDYLYTLTGNDVVILSAWPAEDLAEVGRYHVAGDAIAMFLHGDRLTVISQIVTWGDQYPIPWAADALSFDAIMPWPYFGSPEYTTIVTVLDVSDRTTPSQVQRTEIEGQYVSSRGIGDYVYVSLTHSAVSSGPEVIYSSPDAEMGVYETREEFLARIAQSPGDFIADALPNYTSYGADDNVARTGLLQEPEDVYKPLSEGAMQLVSLVSFNVVGNEPGLSDTAAIYTNGATEVYASLEHFYIFENGWNAEDGNVTRILQFNWDAETGAAQFAAKGLVPGYMLNQFSADEYNGDLRIATTVSRSYVGVFSQTTENDLFVLREDGGVLDFVGSLQNFGVGETLRSVRFMGPRAFVVTYRTVDPLFAIDLTEATKPTIAGYLTIPGFSTYAQMIDDSHLITVGRNTPNGWTGPAQVSLYDVGDLAHPRLLDEYTFERFSTTEAAVDHHAFGYYAVHGLLAVPTSRSYVVRRDANGDGYAETADWVQEYDLQVFRIDVNAAPGSNLGLQLAGEITHDSPVRRSGYIDDKLFSVAEDSVNVVDVNAPNTVIATVAGIKPEPVPPAEDDLRP
ncbi:MAG: beta-propeller domain-containing protein, partial [Planctomycetales bacterium]|nr:beta-propeller domain-containing protein [Planctomycetales bacterium]